MNLETENRIIEGKTDKTPDFTGLPNNERLGISEFGGWVHKDADGEPLGYGSSPTGALMGRYRRSEAISLSERWRQVQNENIGGGDLT